MNGAERAEGAEDMLIALWVRRVWAEGGREGVEGGEGAEACAEGARIEGDRGAARPGDGLRMLCTSPSRVHL